MLRSTFFLVSISSALFIAACGSSDKGDLFGGTGTGGSSSGGTGNSSSGGSGGSSGSDGGGPSGGSSGSDGGGPSGGAPSGGAAGAQGGAPSGGGAPTGGASGSDGGRPSGGAPGGGGVPTGGGGNPGGGGTGGGGNTTCAGKCGQSFATGCQCDELCGQFGDCCGDYASSCLAGVVDCGNGTCKLGNEWCCQTYLGSWQAQCVGTFCGGTDINCDGPEDCDGGQVCCAQISGGGNYFTDFTCQAAAACTGNRRVVCGSTPSVCPTGTTCKATNSPPGYMYCGF